MQTLVSRLGQSHQIVFSLDSPAPNNLDLTLLDSLGLAATFLFLHFKSTLIVVFISFGSIGASAVRVATRVN